MSWCVCGMRANEPMSGDFDELEMSTWGVDGGCEPTGVLAAGRGQKRALESASEGHVGQSVRGYGRGGSVRLRRRSHPDRCRPAPLCVCVCVSAIGQSSTVSVSWGFRGAPRRRSFVC